MGDVVLTTIPYGSIPDTTQMQIKFMDDIFIQVTQQTVMNNLNNKNRDISAFEYCTKQINFFCHNL